MLDRVLVVGLTGGIGSGKSSVGALLRARGATVLDADDAARRVVEPGQPALAAIAERFGNQVVKPDGSLDRDRLGKLVFGGEGTLQDLNNIVHPPVRALLRDAIEKLKGTAEIVVLEIPLLVENRGIAVDVIVVVDTDAEVAKQRLTARGMNGEDVEKRMASQATRDQRLAAADYVIENNRGESELAAEVEKLWAWLQQRATESRDTSLGTI